MANDATTQIPQGSNEADMAASAHDGDYAAVQVAEATPAVSPATSPATPVDGKTVHVDIPQGGTVVRVPVQAGETVILPPPFDSHHDLAAKEGNGNLAIKVGDVTVILQGYIDAANDPQHPVTLDGSDGQPIDIAVVLASTDPNLDIQTAAGPAAGAQGADNTGAILAALAGGPGLGGLNAVGVLDQTDLQYKLIDNSIRQELVLNPNTPAGPLTISVLNPQGPLHQSFLHDPVVTLNQLQGHLDFDTFIHGLPGSGQQTFAGFNNSQADFDGTQANPGAENEHAIGTIFVDPSNDTTVQITLTTTALEAKHLTSDGIALHYEVSADGQTIFGFRGDGSGGSDGALVLVVHVGEHTTGDGTAQQFPVNYYLVNRLDDTTNGGTQINLDVSFDVQTNDDRSATGTISETILDDNPIAVSNSYDVQNHDGITVNKTSGVEHNDNFGADGKIGAVLSNAGDGGVVGVQAGDTKTTHVGGADADVHGQFGTLHLDANGSFTYTRDDTGPTKGDQNDTFTYTIEDDDGDLTSTTLTVHINDHGVIIVPPPPPGGGDDPIKLNSSGTAVFESALSTGSDPTSNTETTSGQVKITAPDGIGSVTITDAGGKDHVVSVGEVVAGKHGDLTITSYDFKTGEIDYSYTLKDPEQVSGPGNNVDLKGEDFKVTATDTDGDKSTGDIVIAIVDDVPTAKADLDVVNQAAGSTTSGNVVTGLGDKDASLVADVKGADSPVSVVDIENAAKTDGKSDGKGGFDVTGTYGTLHMNGDGTYTYTVGAGGMVQGKDDVFTYTIQDKDGDTSTTTLTISSSKTPDITQETPGSHPGEVDVYEAGLPAGSKDGPTNTTAVGTFLIDSHGEGFQSLNVGGVNVPLTGAGLPISVKSDATGTFEITGVTDKGNGSYEITYEYDLKAPINDGTPNTNDGHNPVTIPTFDITATDTSGDQAHSTITVKVVDDVPFAHDESVDVANQHGYVSGTNVETNDVFGADGKSGGGVVGVAAGVTNADAATNVGTDVHGQFGTLHLNADGTFTYNRDSDAPTNGAEVDKFTYTIKDGDGDTSHAVLTVNINDHGVTVTPPGEPPLTPPPGSPPGTPPSVPPQDPSVFTKGTVVYESGLATGSHPDATTITASNTVSVTAPDGVGKVTVNGTEVSLDGSSKTVTGTYGDLTVHWDSGKSELDYSYTLTHNDPNNSGQGNDIVIGEDFKVEVTDTDGDKNSGDVLINIVDDVPTAKADLDDVAFKAGSTTSGNVISGAGDATSKLVADVKGADSPTTLTAITNSHNAGGVSDGKGGFNVTGDYGTLHINADGSYTYTVGANGIAQGKNDVFNYTIKDADGDTSTTTLTIDTTTKPDITQETPGSHPGEVDVYEAGLPAGSKDGPTAISATGTFLVDSHGEGFTSLTVGGKDVPLSGGGFPVVVSSDATGTLEVTKVTDKGNGAYEITYEYDLKAPINDGTPGVSDGHNAVVLPDVPIVATDKSGDAASSTISVHMVDDVPFAKVDTDTVNVAVASKTIGNVITGVGDSDSHLQADTTGADGAHISGIANTKSGSAAEVAGKFTIVGDHGTLVIAEDGSYTYTVGKDPLKQGDTDKFTYTLTDADGDTSTTTLTIDVNCPTITQGNPGAHPGELDVYEAGLPAGSKDGPTDTVATGTFTIDSHSEGFTSLTVGGKAIDLSGTTPTTISSDATGTMQVTGVHNDGNGAYTLTYQYTLNHNILDSTPTSDGHNPVTLPTYSVVATDKSGDQATSSLTVKVVDDIPVAHDATKALTALGGNFNVLLTLDLSNSMNDSSGVSNGQGGTLSKLQLEKQAIAQLLHTYDTQGNVAVHVVWFNDPGSGSSSNTGVGANDGGWMSVQDAITYVNGLVAQGNTNYDVAINKAEQSFNDLTGYIANGTNVSYFLSDGMPNENGGPGSDGKDGITGQQKLDWEAFLDNHDVNSYAIGVGGAAVESALTPVAYDGATNPATDPAGNTIIVTDLSQLSSVINGTVPQGADGNLVGDVSGTYGADGQGHINSFSVEGSTAVAFDAAHPIVSVTTAEGTFVLNMLTGDYTYTPKVGVAQTGVDITFNLIDGDGDVSNSATLHLVPVNHAPVIISNGGGDTAAVSVAENVTAVTTVHATNSDIGATLAFSITGGADKSLFNIDGKTGALTFVNAPDFENPQDAGKNNVYDVVVTTTDNVGATDTQAIAVTVTNKAELPVATDDTVYTTQHDAAKIQDSWILANDKAGDGGAVSFDKITNQTNLSATHSGDTTSLTALFGASDKNHVASIDYQITDTKGQHDTAHVAINLVTGSTIDQSGNTHDVILIGSSANETLKGGSGDDVIVTGGGTDTVDGGKGFDQVSLSGNQTWSSSYTNVEMANLHDGAANKLTINAADVFQQSAGTVGGKDVDLFVTGDHDGATKDSVSLNGFQAVGGPSVSFTDAGTNTTHTYDLYQGTGTHTNVVVAVEHDLTATIAP